MAQETPSPLQAKADSLSLPKLKEFNNWLKDYQNTLDRYGARADEVGITVPQGEFMPIDGAKTINVTGSGKEETQPSHADPDLVEKRLGQIGQYGFNEYEGGYIDQTLTFVGRDGRKWVGANTEENIRALEKAGFIKGNVENKLNMAYVFTDPDLQAKWSNIFKSAPPYGTKVPLQSQEIPSGETGMEIKVKPSVSSNPAALHPDDTIVVTSPPEQDLVQITDREEEKEAETREIEITIGDLLEANYLLYYRRKPDSPLNSKAASQLYDAAETSISDKQIADYLQEHPVSVLQNNVLWAFSPEEELQRLPTNEQVKQYLADDPRRVLSFNRWMVNRSNKEVAKTVRKVCHSKGLEKDIRQMLQETPWLALTIGEGMISTQRFGGDALLYYGISQEIISRLKKLAPDEIEYFIQSDPKTFLKVVPYNIEYLNQEARDAFYREAEKLMFKFKEEEPPRVRIFKPAAPPAEVSLQEVLRDLLSGMNKGEKFFPTADPSNLSASPTEADLDIPPFLRKGIIVSRPAEGGSSVVIKPDEISEPAEAEILQRYQAQADKVGVKIPQGDFIPVDNQEIIYGWQTAKGTIQPSHINPKEVEERLPQVGFYGGNGGVLTFVGRDGRYWVGFESDENIAALEAAGYKNSSVYGTPANRVRNIMNTDCKFADPNLQAQWHQWKQWEKLQTKTDKKTISTPETRTQLEPLFNQLQEKYSQYSQRPTDYSSREVVEKEIKELEDKIGQTLDLALGLNGDASYQTLDTERERSRALKDRYVRLLKAIQPNHSLEFMQEASKHLPSTYDWRDLWSAMQDVVEAKTGTKLKGGDIDRWQSEIYAETHTIAKTPYLYAFLRKRAEPSLENLGMDFIIGTQVLTEGYRKRADDNQKAVDFLEAEARKAGINIEGQ